MTAIRIAVRIVAWTVEIAVLIALPYGTVAFLIDAFSGMPLNHAVIAGVAAVGAALLLIWAITRMVEMALSWTTEAREGERVANVIDGMRRAGRETLDVFQVMQIWYDEQPQNNPILRRATKEGRYAILREAVQRGWLRSDNMPEERGRNYSCNIHDLIRFFRGRMWLQI